MRSLFGEPAELRKASFCSIGKKPGEVCPIHFYPLSKNTGEGETIALGPPDELPGPPQGPRPGQPPGEQWGGIAGLPNSQEQGLAHFLSLS